MRLFFILTILFSHCIQQAEAASQTIGATYTDTILVQINQQICKGDSIEFFGEWLSTAGIYEHFESDSNFFTLTIFTLDIFENAVISFQTKPACPYQLDGEIQATVSGEFPPFHFLWNTGDTAPVLTGIDTGSYSLAVTDANGCKTSAVIALDGVKKPKIEGEIQDATCFGYNDGSLTVMEYDPSLRFSFFGSEFSSKIQYDSIYPGNWQLFVLDTFGCIWEEFFAIEQPNPVFLQLPDNVQIALGDSIEIKPGIEPDSLQFAWTPDVWLSCANCQNPVATPQESIVYSLTATDTHGCQAHDSIHIFVKLVKEILIPTAFSPNGDGLNDRFYVLGKGISTIREFRVFDRWGEKVYEAENFEPNKPSLGWDGNYKGKPATPDTFVFWLLVQYVDGSEEIKKGSVTLLR